MSFYLFHLFLFILNELLMYFSLLKINVQQKKVHHAPLAFFPKFFKNTDLMACEKNN